MRDAALAPGPAADRSAPGAALPWCNWPGSGTAAGPLLRPSSVDELAAIVAAAPSLRAVGAGHSFMPLLPGPGARFLTPHLEALFP